ncbi:MAG: putative lipid II flippase FtsW [Hyphomicrobiaceae bacterium]|nr:putative lipid II flippase FtsW [Hyphomicrobiaceae bacterium]
MRISRTDRSLLAEWWFTVDRVLLAAILVLAGSGLVLSLAASPAVALKKALPAFHFVERHIVLSAIGAVIMLAVSMMQPRMIRRLALVVFVAALALMAAVLIGGEEINGARRWLRFAGFSLQPSELAKPAFVVLAAWAFSEAQKQTDMPARAIAVALCLAFAALLLMQPDVGQTMLVCVIWTTLFVLSGQPLIWAAVFALIGSIGLAGAYFTLDYVRLRVDRFLGPGADETSQTARALQSFVEGGFLGRGPGEGTIKTSLPDAHTDFIFAVVAEEYGALACLALAALFATIVLRAYFRTFTQPDPFVRLAVAGLALLFGLQAAINMAVNVGLLPAKGMTLPFISAGGSSLVSVFLAMGMMLALTRRRPDALRLRRPHFPRTTEDRLGNMGPAAE